MHLQMQIDVGRCSAEHKTQGRLFHSISACWKCLELKSEVQNVMAWCSLHHIPSALGEEGAQFFGGH